MFSNPKVIITYSARFSLIIEKYIKNKILKKKTEFQKIHKRLLTKKHRKIMLDTKEFGKVLVTEHIETIQYKLSNKKYISVDCKKSLVNM